MYQPQLDFHKTNCEWQAGIWLCHLMAGEQGDSKALATSNHSAHLEDYLSPYRNLFG